MTASPMLTSTQIKDKALEIGFHKVGIAKVGNINVEVQHLQEWLNKGYQADMAWMNNLKRQDIRLVMPEALSVLCVALNYYTPTPTPK